MGRHSNDIIGVYPNAKGMDIPTTSVSIGLLEKVYRVRHMLKVWRWWSDSTIERRDYARLRDRLRMVRHGFDEMDHGDIAFLHPFRMDQAKPAHRESLTRFYEYLKDLRKTLRIYGWTDSEVYGAFPAVRVFFAGEYAGPVAEELARHDVQLARLERTTRTWFYHIGRRLRAADQRSQGIPSG